MELHEFVIPGAKIRSEIMEPTAGFQNSIPETCFPISDFVFDDPIAFDPTDGMFDPNAQRSMPLVNVFLQIRKCFAFRLLFGLKDSNLIQFKTLKTSTLD